MHWLLTLATLALSLSLSLSLFLHCKRNRYRLVCILCVDSAPTRTSLLDARTNLDWPHLSRIVFALITVSWHGTAHLQFGDVMGWAESIQRQNETARPDRQSLFAVGESASNISVCFGVSNEGVDHLLPLCRYRVIQAIQVAIDKTVDKASLASSHYFQYFPFESGHRASLLSTYYYLSLSLSPTLCVCMWCVSMYNRITDLVGVLIRV